MIDLRVFFKSNILFKTFLNLETLHFEWYKTSKLLFRNTDGCCRGKRMLFSFEGNILIFLLLLVLVASGPIPIFETKFVDGIIEILFISQQEYIHWVSHVHGSELLVWISKIFRTNCLFCFDISFNFLYPCVSTTVCDQ